MGLFSEINRRREERGEKPSKHSSLGELREKRFSLAKKGLKFKESSGAKQYLANKKQSRINKAINSPK